MSTTTPSVQKTIESITRLRNSTNGNPRFLLTFTDGSEHRTMSDASFGYEVGNPGYRAGDTVDLYLTRAGQIRYATRA